MDAASGTDWALAGAELVDVTSANTSIASAYRLVDPFQGNGGDASPFPGGNITYEMWVRPARTRMDIRSYSKRVADRTEHQSSSATTRCECSTAEGNERGFDIEVPLADVDTSDFVQIETALNQADGEITVTVNGSAGGTATSVEQGTIGRGGNRASLFTWGSGLANSGNPADEPGGTFTLGGRTELERYDARRPCSIRGDIAILNVFSRALDADEIQAAFDSVAASSLPGDFNADGQLDAEDINQLSAAVRAATNDPAFDLNDDNVVDQADRTVWINELRNTWTGDSNLDGEFNSGDFVAVFTAGEFEDAFPLNSTWETATGMATATSQRAISSPHFRCGL